VTCVLYYNNVNNCYSNKRVNHNIASYVRLDLLLNCVSGYKHTVLIT
jgi:hypothetical protein